MIELNKFSSSLQKYSIPTSFISGINSGAIEPSLGYKPRGLWPSEGSIAPELIPLMQKVGIEYFCSDEENLFNSIKLDPA